MPIRQQQDLSQLNYDLAIATDENGILPHRIRLHCDGTSGYMQIAHTADTVTAHNSRSLRVSHQHIVAHSSYSANHRDVCAVCSVRFTQSAAVQTECVSCISSCELVSDLKRSELVVSL